MVRDNISCLPDEILIHILSFLPTKYAVCTSALSRRWVGLYTFVPFIDLDDSDYINPRDYDPKFSVAFTKFVDNVVSINQSPKLLRFCLFFIHCTSEFFPHVNAWVQALVLRNVVQIELCVPFCDENLVDRFIIPPCESLEILSTCGSCLPVQMPSSGCFANLKVLEVILLFDGTDTEVGMARNLFTSLPKLKELMLGVVGCGFSCLVPLNICCPRLRFLYVDIRTKECPIIAIDAPQLENLMLGDHYVSSYVVGHLPNLQKVQLKVGRSCSVFTSFHLLDLVPSISRAKSLSANASTMKALLSAYDNSLPVFQFLTNLDLTLHTCQWYLIIDLLQSFPNLTSFVLEEEMCSDDIYFIDWTKRKSAPRCLSFHLKEVSLKGLAEIRASEMVNYLLLNAKVLETIKVDPCKKLEKICIRAAD